MLTLVEALTMFLTDCQARNLSPKTLRFYRQQLGAFVSWLAARGVGDVAAVTADLIRSYITALQDRGLAAASVHAGARSVRAWFTFLERDDRLTERNPVRRVRMPKLPVHLLPALAPEEITRLLAAAAHTETPERDAAILLALMDSGLRASELCALTWRDVDLVSGRVFIGSGKGDRDRVVFLGKRARTALDAYRGTLGEAGPGSAVFRRGRSRHGAGDLTYDGLKELLRRLGRAAGVAHVYAHRFRRTFAVEMLRSGADLVRTSRIMGHRDLTMLNRHYLPLVDDDLATVHRSHSPADRLG